jgi:hypothetical protein
MARSGETREPCRDRVYLAKDQLVGQTVSGGTSGLRAWWRRRQSSQSMAWPGWLGVAWRGAGQAPDLQRAESG